MSKPKLQLVGEDGNAFSILARWRRAARGAGWTSEAIEEVLAKATSGDYNHLLATIMENSEEPYDDEYDWDEYDEEAWLEANPDVDEEAGK